MSFSEMPESLIDKVSTLRVKEFSVDNNKIVAIKYLAFDVYHYKTDNLYTVRKDELGVDIYEYELHDIEKALNKELEFLWRNYVKESVDLLDNKAKIVKYNLLNYFREI